MNTKFIELETLETYINNNLLNNQTARQNSQKRIKNLVKNRFESLHNDLKQEIIAKENSVENFSVEL